MLAGTAWGYLLVYNAMFVVPLIVILTLAYAGMRTDALIQWSRGHVVPSKVFMGIFFVGMSVAIWIL
jgi:hypothetical protein